MTFRRFVFFVLFVVCPRPGVEKSHQGEAITPASASPQPQALSLLRQKPAAQVSAVVTH